MPPVKFQSIWSCCFGGDAFSFNQPIRNKNYRWRPYLLTNQDKMSNLYKGPLKMPSVKSGSIWPCCFGGDAFSLIQPTRNKNFKWRPCLLTDRNRIGNIYIGPYIEFFVKFGSIWPSCFIGVNENVKSLRRRRTSSDDKSSHGLWPGELIIKIIKQSVVSKINFSLARLI